MKTAKIRVCVLFAIALLLLLCTQVSAVPGDCNADGFVNASDMAYIVQYLFANGPPPNMVDCDCDWYPGVNYGDFWQLTEALFMGAALYASPGNDVPMPSNVEFLVVIDPDGVAVTNSVILVKSPVAVDCAALPFSFAPDPANADLICTSVDFTGSVGTNLQATIDNVGKFFIISNGMTPTIPITPNWALFATANFALDPGGTGPGTPVTVHATSTPRIFPMLLMQGAYAGVNQVRVEFPTFMPNNWMLIGDANCDGQIDIDDAVYLIQYIFVGGPPPGDPDGDGVPNC